jgi:hypothetical protein
MGKKSNEKANTALDAQNKVAEEQVKLANRQQDIGEQIWRDTGPARDYATNTYMGLAKGNVPGIEKYTAPSINAATQQFYLARKAVESMPPGAARDAAMRDINMQEAGTKTNIYSGGMSDALARTGSMGWGGVGMTTGALGAAGTGLLGASGSYGNIGQSYQQMASDKGGMAASGAGTAGAVIGALA